MPFVALLRGPPLRFGVGSSSTSDTTAIPFVYDVDRFASRPDAFLVVDFVDGLDIMRLGVFSFLLLEARGESSMVGSSGAKGLSKRLSAVYHHRMYVISFTRGVRGDKWPTVNVAGTERVNVQSRVTLRFRSATLAVYAAGRTSLR